MSDPTWLDAIRDAYLADRASVFLLHGPGVQSGWSVDGSDGDLLDAAVAFLARTREVVGRIEPPAGLRFPGLGDIGRFERLVSAAELIAGRHVPLREDVPGQALGKIWIALADTTTAQGYVVGRVDRLYPAHRKQVEPLGGGAPPLWDWCSAPRVRASNHIVILAVPDLAAVRPELVEAAFPIAVDAPTGTTRSAPRAPEPPPLAPAGPANPPPGRPVSCGKRPDPEELAPLIEALTAACLAALAAHPETARPSKLPVMDAVARVVGERTGSPGPLTWSLDDEGAPVAAGDGGDAFLARWRADIALDAAAGMLIRDAAPDHVNPTAVAALARRVLKWG